MSGHPVIKLLMIDDDPDICTLVDAMLAKSKLASYQVTHTQDSAHALNHINTGDYDLCLVDQNLGQSINGIDLITQFKDSHTPMVLITADQCEQLDYQAMQAGAVGFVHKEDITLSVLDRTLRYALARDSKIRELQSETAAHKELASTDQLTGLPNRREFDRRLTAAIAGAARNNEQLALVYIDLNGFKRVNDTHGHAAGDKILQVISSRLLGEFRESDSLCRVGGDEFVAIITSSIPDTPMIDVCKAMIERLAKRADGAIEIGRTVIHVGASFGLATYPEDGLDIVTLLQAADNNMFKEKKGRSFS